jgi:predicted HAD superfamily Cof-like phosphohydrolase
MKRQIEQVREFRKAFNLSMSVHDCNHVLHYDMVEEESNEMFRAKNNVEIADAIIDQMYLLIGYAINLQIEDKLEALFDEVHRSNMSKLDKDGNPIYREDGKVMKGENYSRPNLKDILLTSKV